MQTPCIPALIFLAYVSSKTQPVECRLPHVCLVNALSHWLSMVQTSIVSRYAWYVGPGRSELTPHPTSIEAQTNDTPTMKEQRPKDRMNPVFS